jgi:hypothetical protein
MHTGAKLNFLIFIIYVHHVRTCINGWMDYISSHHMKAEMQIEISINKPAMRRYVRRSVRLHRGHFAKSSLENLEFNPQS